MALNSLATEQMLFVSHHWLNHPDTQQLLAKVPELTGLLPRIKQAHLDLEDSLAASKGTRSQQIKELKELSANIDRNHDRMVRAIYAVLSGLAEGADSEEDTQTFVELRDRIFPQGLGTTKRAYMAEVAEARMVDKRLSKADKSLLATIPLPNKKKLSHWVEQFQAYAEELGEALAQIETLEKDDAFDTSTVRPKDIHRCRVQWIRIVHALQASLLISESLSEQEQHRVLGHLEKAQTQAERRKSGSQRNVKEQNKGQEGGSEDPPAHPLGPTDSQPDPTV
jgi:hypothetical protein